ncbi:DUF3696 domain-containing protein [Cupriavidus alkaliphilus]|uniref:DUF3696 domain-containing protein n=1 Tax=Cupriavidus alkaliphilus TaxID=942866 RepID=UPI001614F112|nr:DUF3696 domain-containing protein [Cupriavidus alkaliphilus]MBB2918106.1 hypothetical protein [Cupriavidus alkaliphilus]
MKVTQVSKLRIENLRGILDTDFIDLKPITLLVGKNSAGKSSFSRIFPLLRQSGEAVRSAPVLWWGKYVDYGDFSRAVSRHADKREISFSFAFDVEPGIITHTDFVGFRRSAGMLAAKATAVVRVSIAESEKGESYISNVNLKMFDLTCDLKISEDNLVEYIQCGSVIWRPKADGEIIGHVTTGQFLPDIYFSNIDARDESKTRKIYPGAPLKELFHSYLRAYIHGNASHASMNSAARQVVIADRDTCLLSIQGSRSGPPSWRENAKKFVVNGSGLRNLRCASFMEALSGILQSLNEKLGGFADGVRYMEPIRATAQRFYRQQELSLTEIDPKGDNLAIFINSFKKHLGFGQFNNWLKAHLDFRVAPAVEGAQIEMKIALGDSQEATNLADMGFGYSQILPIATQLWASAHPRLEVRRRSGNNTQSCIVIEQPELHLHPAYQGRIADLFVATIGEAKKANPGPIALSIIAETHSSALVNRLGELVATKVIPKDDVQILLFEQTDHSAPASVRSVGFDEEGVLENWPFGFFSGTAYE